MIPLIFIVVVSLVLMLLVYWVLSTIKSDNPDKDVGSFYFETAPELYTYGYLPDILPYIPYESNQLKLCRGSASYLLAFWMVAEGEEPAAGQRDLSLRIYQTSAGVVFTDIPVSNLKGSHYFKVEPGRAYYAVLGDNHNGSFDPWLYSNTLLIPAPENLM